MPHPFDTNGWVAQYSRARHPSKGGDRRIPLLLSVTLVGAVYLHWLGKGSSMVTLRLWAAFISPIWA